MTATATLHSLPEGVARMMADATLAALAPITDPGQDGYHDTAAGTPTPVGHLSQPSLLGSMA
jgi:hypothetical protein